MRRGLLLASCIVVLLAAVPGAAEAQQCPEKSPIYTDACGPTFAIPAWGDAGGWTDLSKYSTIQLADFNGDGKDELMARNDQGIEVYWFDTSLGQWSPQVDARGTPQVLSDFRSPLPSETPATDWTKPQYYATIQTDSFSGDGQAQILARFADGMSIYDFQPGPGGSINGGSWTLLGKGGPFSDADGWDDPSRYLTIRTGSVDLTAPPQAKFLIGLGKDGLVEYEFSAGYWDEQRAGDSTGVEAFNGGKCAVPSCFELFRVAQLCAPSAPSCSTSPQVLVGRTSEGVNLVSHFPGAWLLQPGSADLSPTVAGRVFGDEDGGPDCPFAGGSGAGDCLGSSPTYTASFDVADLDGDGVDEIFARAADGLRVKKLDVATGNWSTLPTLTDLKGDAGVSELLQFDRWMSIRTANLDGRGGDEVLALDGTALQAWSYDPASKSWQRWTPTTALTLNGNTWTTHPENIATLRTGDVDGDGRDEVVARGPFGIRTWFYNRRGTGGWEPYLPGGYPALTTPGQQAALTQLDTLAVSQGVVNGGATTVREMWTKQIAADDTALAKLQTGLANSLVGNCTNQTRVEPPTYAACTPPAGSTGFKPDEWTTVVNTLLNEAELAEDVFEHFGILETVRQDVFESEAGDLPAIGDDLQLAGAAGNSGDFSTQGLFAGGTGLAASLAGLASTGGPEVSAALWVISELFSMLPSASPSAVSEFDTTYDGLLTQLATARDEMSDALKSQRQQVLNDAALLALVGQLRSQGTWALDPDGMQSASRQAFVYETYKTLMPTVYERYQITNCTQTNSIQTCTGPSAGPGVIGGGSGFTALSMPPTTQAGTYVTPCWSDYTDWTCHYDQNAPSAKLATAIWGDISANCAYDPGDDGTLWDFGRCSLGVPASASVGSSPGWNFSTLSGNPVALPGYGAARARAGVVRAASTVRATRQARGARGSHAVLGPLRFRGRVALAKRLRLRRLRVVLDRTLFEHGRREQLARTRAGRRVRRFALRHARGRVYTASRRGGARVRLRLGRQDARGRTRLHLRLTRVRVRDLRALCTVLPAGVGVDARPLELETRLRLRDGSVRSTISLRQRWRCVRDRRRNFSGIRPIKPTRPALRPGVTLRMGAPRLTAASGRRATVRVTVGNRRRRGSSRVVSSLWDLRLRADAGRRARIVDVEELRARRTRTVRLRVPVARDARGRRCVRVTATAASARAAFARRCVAGADRADE